MKTKFLGVVAIASLVALGGCNKETPQAQNVAEVTDNVADNVDVVAENTSGNVNDALENKADAIRHDGKEDAKMIDKAADNGASNMELNAMANSAKAKAK